MVVVESFGVYYIERGLNALDEITTPNVEYAEIGVQSEYVIDADEGKVQIVDLKYDFHNRGNHDAYTVTAKSLGPGHKKGKLVYYNTVDKTVYKEVPFNDLAPGEEITDTIENADDMIFTMQSLDTTG